HREMREIALYELTVSKGGPKIRPYIEDPNEPTPEPGKPALGKDGRPIPRPGGIMFTMGPGPREVTARKQSIAQMAASFAIDVGRPVVDKTGLTGEYDYTMRYTPNVAQPQAEAGGDAPDLFTAVQEQLGLKLESKKGPVEMLVVDGGQRTPAQN